MYLGIMGVLRTWAVFVALLSVVTDAAKFKHDTTCSIPETEWRASCLIILLWDLVLVVHFANYVSDVSVSGFC